MVFDQERLIALDEGGLGTQNGFGSKRIISLDENKMGTANGFNPKRLIALERKKEWLPLMGLTIRV